jgi:hypothetical protein
MNDDIEEFYLTDERAQERSATVPRKIQQRRQQFVKVPWTWIEKLEGASGQTYHVAHYLLHLHWQQKGGPVKLANGMLRIDGVSRQSKWRALRDLEQRGLVTVKCRPNRSPLVHLSHF